MTNKRRNVKKNNFLAEKMENKPVTDLPGIGTELGDRLKKKGFRTAEDVYKKYLDLGRNRNLFKEWMENEIEADANQSNLTFDCLHAYHATHGNQPCSQAIKMCSTTQKHRDFVAEPMRDEPVTELAGIGRVLGERLKAAGFDKAHNVLGQYSLFRKNTEIFQEWMKDTCNAATNQSQACYQWLCEWSDAFL